MNKAKQLGFSLIELIFVIAIIGVMASLGVSYYQHRTENTKIQKAALQMQQVMQAGQAYYADNGCWPGNCPTTQSAPDFTKYIPGQLQPLNPWGKQIAWQTIPTGGASSLFRTYTCTPTEDAQKLEALLPNAQMGKNCSSNATTKNSTAVCADVTSNGSESNNQFIIKGFSQAWLGSQKVTVECNNDYTPGIMVAAQSAHVNDKWAMATVNWDIDLGGFTCIPAGSGKKSCTAYIHADGNHKERVLATYMTYCKNNSA